MARKKKFNYKNLKVDESDLAITKIGEMPNENKSPIFLFLVFGILIVFVFFLPDVVNYFSNDNSTIIGGSPVDNENDPKEEEVENKLTYYDLDSSLVVDLEEGIKINNFKIANNTLYFTITNSNDSKFYFSKRNYFAELYTGDNTLLERIMLSKDSITKDVGKDFTYSLKPSTAQNAKKIVFVEKQVEDYPNVVLQENEAKESTLNCTQNFETITYNFLTEKLVKITDVINYTNTGNDLAYQTDLALWQSRSTNYNNMPGVTSAFLSVPNGFSVNTILDLKDVNISNIDNENYYEYETLAKVVKFEMESRGFSCN